jgi:hypothetical protein
MKTIAQIIGGAQALLAVSFELKECFEDHLTGEGQTLRFLSLWAAKHAFFRSSGRKIVILRPPPVINFLLYCL